MSGDMLTELHEWVLKVLGVDPRHSEKKADAPLQTSAQNSKAAATPVVRPPGASVSPVSAAPPTGGSTTQSMPVSALTRTTAEAGRQAAAESTGADHAVQDLRDSAAELIDGIEDANAKTILAQDLAKLDSAIKAAAGMADPNNRATARHANDQAAQDLIAAAAKAAKSTGAKEKVQAAYKKALEEKFGLRIGGETGSRVNNNMHYDLAYQTLDKMPVGHVVHDALKGLSYNKRMNLGDHGIGQFSGAEIQLGDFPDKQETVYTDPVTKKREAINSYSITVLHELGHSVDTRFGIMKKYGHQKGGGGWEVVDVKTLIDRVSRSATQALAGALTDEVVREAVSTLLTTHKLVKPNDEVSPDGWTKLEAHLHHWIELMKMPYPYAMEPFEERGYIPHSSGKWDSYLRSDRAATFVRAYQWSAPAEWFAELYAMCWYNKKPGPSGVHSGILPYLPQRDGSAGVGAPQA